MAPDRISSDPAFLAAYGDAVCQVREKQGLDRRELAEAAGISYSYLSAIESGQKLPSGTVQTVLADALNIPASSLLALANGVLDSDAMDEQASDSEPVAMLMADVKHRTPSDASPARQVFNHSAAHRPAPGVSPSGALAELQALIPSLAPEDAAMVVSMARRLAAERGSEPRTRSSRRHRGTGGRGLRTEAYLQFWTMYLDQLDKQELDWAEGRRPEPRSYFTTPSPLRSASLSASFARNRLLRHELYINRGSRSANLELLHELEAKRDAVEAAYGHRLEFEDPGRERRAVRIAEYREGHISHTEDFDDYIAWFVDRGVRMRQALVKYVEEA